MAQARHLELFLNSANAVHNTGGGTKETSFYTALNNLLNGIGNDLKPKVKCVMQLKNLGAGNPDGGLFTPDQFDRKTGEAKDGIPSRGVIEVKAPVELVDDTAATGQITKYWDRYKLVLVTNLRDWLLLGERNGQRVTLERFSLASNEAAFWALAQHSSKAQTELGEAFQDFLTRVLQHNAPLADPKDLAFLLASYAREARHRVEHATETAAKQLEALQQSLESSLGVTFNANEGGHFFRSTLVQTLFYGVFSAWVLRREQAEPGQKLGPFDWKSAAHSLNVPMIAALFGQLSQPAKLKALNLTEVLDWATDALNRVDEAAFFKTFESTRSIQYFYEPFLAEFDPELRKSLGVWYTPEEIVRYQVARVDQVLQSELGLPDGLADPNVVVLDPCCGTGAYLVEVLRVIGQKLKAQGADALAAHQLKLAATTRLFGFELLPAPYVVAHLQLGLLLRQLGAPLAEDERAGIYLTNALTGWEPAKEPKSAVLPFPEFEQERDAADHVKQTQKIIVIIGNPPYSAFGGVGLGEESDLVAPYKEGLIKKWGIKKFNLDDLYVRFFRLAERRIAEKGGRGVVSYISNYSWSTEPSFVVLRERLLKNFDKFWIDNMHGNRNISEYSPDGRTSETVFAQDGFSPGIRQGVVVSLWVKTGEPDTPKQIFYCDSFNQAKAAELRKALLDSLNSSNHQANYIEANPNTGNRLSFKPSDVGSAYSSWSTLSELAEIRSDGVFEKRAGSLIDIDKSALILRMKAYFDPERLFSEITAIVPGLTNDAARFDAAKTREKLLKLEKYSELQILRLAVRPFDVRWCYYSPNRPLWNEPRPTLRQHFGSSNKFLVSRLKTGASGISPPMYMSSALIDGQVISVNPSAIPLQLTAEKAGPQDDWFANTQANLSELSREYLSNLGLLHPDSDRNTAELIWMHALAIGYSPAYLSENTDGIRENWPRIPLPASKEALMASAALGREVAALLDTEAAVPGVTSGTIRDELKTIAVVSRVGGGALQAAEFALTAGWGSGGKDGKDGKNAITMPGKGKTEPRHAETSEQASGFGSAPTLDVYLNAKAYWKNIPQPVYDFTIGGYQVIKKWLSYREQRVLGRALTMAEIMEVTAMARRLAALVLLQPKLDENYRATSSDTWSNP